MRALRCSKVRRPDRSKSVGMLACAVASLTAVVFTVKNPVYHIVEETGAIDWMAEAETPTEEYYEALRADFFFVAPSGNAPGHPWEGVPSRPLSKQKVS